MDDFLKQLQAWQPFFITLAGVSATLAGLLFVAVSLHPARQDEGARTNLRRLAEHTFADLVQVLFIGVFFAVPGQPPGFYGFSMVAITGMGLREPLRRLLETWRDRDHVTHRRHFINRLGLSLLGRALLCVGGISLIFSHATAAQVESAMSYVFSGSVVLLIAAMRNAWFLILQEAT